MSKFILELIASLTLMTGEDLRSVECMTELLWWEARGEPLSAIADVGSVVINRKNNPRFPNSVCEVKNQNNQFSYFFDGKSDKISPADPTERRKLHDIIVLAGMLVREEIMDQTNGAVHYYNPFKVCPAWAQYAVSAKMNGNHLFVLLEGY